MRDGLNFRTYAKPKKRLRKRRRVCSVIDKMTKRVFIIMNPQIADAKGIPPC
jgi:hypothetical protein